ncbi:MAG: NTP transferase domain-containing protein [Myxococcota bacterium]
MKRIGLILTGGAARRMRGKAKHGLRHVGGETLLHRTYRVLSLLTDETWLVGEGSSGHPFIEDPRRGPAAAVSMAAQRFPGAWLVVCPSDLARPNPKLLARLSRFDPSWDAITVGAHGEWAQLLLGVSADFARHRGDGGFRPWWRFARRVRLSLGALGSAERAGLVDVDSPLDAARLHID